MMQLSTPFCFSNGTRVRRGMNAGQLNGNTLKFNAKWHQHFSTEENLFRRLLTFHWKSCAIEKRINKTSRLIVVKVISTIIVCMATALNAIRLHFCRQKRFAIHAWTKDASGKSISRNQCPRWVLDERVSIMFVSSHSIGFKVRRSSFLIHLMWRNY